MKCVACGGETEVIDSQKFDTVVWRKRRCLACKQAVTTHETVVEETQQSRTGDRVRTRPEPRPAPPPKEKSDKLTLAFTPSEERVFSRLLERSATSVELRERFEVSNISAMVSKINAKLAATGDQRMIVCERHPFENMLGEISQTGFYRIAVKGEKPSRQRIQELREARENRLLEEEY